MALRDGDWKLLASQDFTHLELYNLKVRPQRDDGPQGEGARAVRGHAQAPGDAERRDRAGRPGLVEAAQPERRRADQEAVSNVVI